jgi:hypothetical protein
LHSHKTDLVVITIQIALLKQTIDKSVTRIVRSESESPSMLQNADFSSKTIKELIAQGETKTMEKLSYCQNLNYDFNMK